MINLRIHKQELLGNWGHPCENLIFFHSTVEIKCRVIPHQMLGDPSEGGVGGGGGGST